MALGEAPDPLDPQPGDQFHDGTEIRKIIWRGARFVISENAVGADERPNLLAAVATWTPIDPGAITEPVVLYEYRIDGQVGWWTTQVARWTGRTIIINPDHTWTSGP